jgi:hypothetical protein
MLRVRESSEYDPASMNRMSTGVVRGGGGHIVVALFALALTTWFCPTRSRADANAIREALENLVPYDLEGTSTLDALAALAVRIEKEKDPRTRRDLGFVRAVALTDIWILANKAGSRAALTRVAQALAVAPEAIPRVLLATLEGVRDPIVQDIVRDSRAALLLSWPEATDKVPFRPIGPRTSVLYVDAVLAAFGPDKHPVPTLASMAEDPCPDMAKCAELYRVFQAQGRRAIRAVETALQVLPVLRDDVTARDPFVQAIAPRIEANAVLLPGLELAPSVQLERADERLHRTSHGTALTPELVAFVGTGKLEVAFVPRVRVTPSGKLELFARGEPMLPAVREIKLGSSFPLIVRSVDEIVSGLTPLHEQAQDARIGIAARPDSPAHLWARALLSAKASGFSRIAMLGLGTDGSLRCQDVEVVSSLHAAEVGPMDLNVMIRLGGFTVSRGGPSISLPRLKGETGFSFDYSGLASSVRPGSAKTTKLTFMSDVAAQTLAETAFMIAPRSNPLTVVLP